MPKALRTMAVAIVLSCAGGFAGAQTPAPPRQEVPPRREQLPTIPKLNLTLEQRHTIREFIKDMKSQATTRDVKAAVGDPVPADVNLQPMPADVGRKVPQVKSHRFFITGDEIVLVNPSDNKVADIINLSEN
jgi:hypothetical protein